MPAPASCPPLLPACPTTQRQVPSPSRGTPRSRPPARDSTPDGDSDDWPSSAPAALPPLAAAAAAAHQPQLDGAFRSAQRSQHQPTILQQRLSGARLALASASEHWQSPVLAGVCGEVQGPGLMLPPAGPKTSWDAATAAAAAAAAAVDVFDGAAGPDVAPRSRMVRGRVRRGRAGAAAGRGAHYAAGPGKAGLPAAATAEMGNVMISSMAAGDGDAHDGGGGGGAYAVLRSRSSTRPWRSRSADAAGAGSGQGTAGPAAGSKRSVRSASAGGCGGGAAAAIGGDVSDGDSNHSRRSTCSHRRKRAQPHRAE